MSIVSEYKCSQCNNIFEVYKQSIFDNFENSYKCPYCQSLETYRLWGKINFDIAEGKTGTTKTNFEKNFIYKPSQIYGRYKGKKIKQIY